MDIQISFFPNAFLIPNSWLFADLYQYGRLSLNVPTVNHPSFVVGHRVRSSNPQLHQEIVHFTFCCTSHFFLYNCKKLLRQLTRSLYLKWQCHKTSPFWLSAFFFFFFVRYLMSFSYSVVYQSTLVSRLLILAEYHTQ